MHRTRLFLLLGFVFLLTCSLVACGGPTKGTAEWYLDRGNKLYEQGRYDEAIEEYSNAIELDPNLADAYYNRGNAYADLGEKTEAVSDFEEFIKLERNLSRIHEALQRLRGLQTPSQDALTPGEVTQEEVEQIVADALTATAEVDIYKFNAEMTLTIEIVGGPDESYAVLRADSTAFVDNANKEMQVIIDMAEETEQGWNNRTEVYIYDGWVYANMDSLRSGEQWMKMRLTEGLWEEQENPILQATEWLETATELNVIGSENVMGVECYAIELTPNLEVWDISLTLSAPGVEGTLVYERGNPALGDLLNEMSVREWIAKDSYQLHKLEVDMPVQVFPSDVGATEGDFERMTMHSHMEFLFWGYNEPISLELPPGALAAQEVLGP